MYTLFTYFSFPFCTLQDGSSVPVAIKTCKVDNEDSMAEKFLEEACKCETIVLKTLCIGLD